MSTRDTKATGFSSAEEDFLLYFSDWLRCRRQELDLTQEQLAKRASCSVFAIRKIELGERRPSRQLAGLLAQALEIPPEDQDTLIRAARGELSVKRLASLIRAPALKSGAAPGNLPRALNPFIRREPELSGLGQLLCDPQCLLLTIVGSGGIGKTRLAIEAANQSKDRFPDGVWFVSLATLNSPALLVPAIADAVNYRFQDPANPQTQLFRYLREKKALLILDNAEHLLDGVGLFIEMLNACPQLKLLITSRERLNLLSEWVFEIQGLPLPPSDRVEQFESYSSVALFLQSARQIRADFVLREEDKRWVLKICQIMEGMPLGIELSAAWVGMLPCEEIAQEIEHNIDFLTVSMRDLPERHRSLRATLDHSWKLLNADEKRILSRLSVFQGSFRREAARDICGASLAALSSFRNKMLLYRRDRNFYSLHELIRQYAELKLCEDPHENERVKDLHSTYYIRCLSEWEKALKNSRQLETFDEMAQVIDNLSQGWQWMITRCHLRIGKNGRLCADLLHSSLFSLSLFYETRCRSWEAIALFTESVEYLKGVQAEFEKTEDASRFVSVLGHITAYLGLHHAYVLQYEKAREYLGEAIRLLETSQSWIERAQAQIMLASIDYRQGQYRKSAALHEQGREVFREAGEDWWYLWSLIHLARTYLSLGKLQEAEALCQEGFRLVEPGDVRLELMLQIEYAYACYLQQDYVQAEQLMQENLQLCQQYRNHRMSANIYIDLSKVMLATDRVEQAEAYLQEGIQLLSEFGESDDLAYGLLHLGKCHLIRLDVEAARLVFRQVITIGKALDMFYLVYWGLVNIARIYWIEGKTEKAYEILLVLRNCPVEYREAQIEGERLLADLQAGLPQGQVETVRQQVEDRASADRAVAYALELEIE
jgi:predicted ATPase/transcriptional regulator with XRE-family HTH domain